MGGDMAAARIHDLCTDPSSWAISWMGLHNSVCHSLWYVNYLFSIGALIIDPYE
jgi:hypothetical protein